VKEESLYGRTGGAATLAVGMANLFSRVVGDRWLGIWYHFALMFEALFILTTLDAGTRVGRYLLQDALGHLWKPLGDVRSLTANLMASAVVVAAWGYFLIAAVYDPEGGIKALWPIFGIANQLLAATALCLATTVILKMTLQGSTKRSPAFTLITLIPLLWLLAVTGTAAGQKIWHPDPKIGFMAGADAAQAKRDDLRGKLSSVPSEQAALHNKAIAQSAKQAFNLRLDAYVTGFFLALVGAIFLLSLREWILLVVRKKLAELHETPPTWLPDYAIANARPLQALSALALAIGLVKELSGEAAIERARHGSQRCGCGQPGHPVVNLLAEEREPLTPEQAYVQVAERRFHSVNRCC
jgi:carbon starvation protein